MSLLLLPLGLLPPAVAGWCVLRLLEGRIPILTRLERGLLGGLLGLTVTMFLVFLAQIWLSVPLTLGGFSFVQTMMLALLIIVLFIRNYEFFPRSPVLPKPDRRQPRWAWILLTVLLIWTGVKVAGGSLMLIGTPPYLDDTLSNWNIRGKVFYYTKQLTLVLPSQKHGDTTPAGTSSYPPAVPLVKTWLSTLEGTWSEPLVNSIHLVWFLLALGIAYAFVRRVSSPFWGLVTVYMFASLPLYLIQGTNSYGDVFLSAHNAAAVGLVFLAGMSAERHQRIGFLRLAAFAIALLPFTKNEGLLLFLPAAALIFIATLLWMVKTKRLPFTDAVNAFLWCVVLTSLIILPWVSFKFAHGLTFGNAKGIGGLQLGWQKGVLQAINVNTFFEGNWLLLFPLFILLLIFAWRAAFKTPFVILLAGFLIIYLGQLPIYLFTGLSTEALYQTGYARGLIQLVPLVVMLTVLLLKEIVTKWKVES